MSTTTINSQLLEALAQLLVAEKAIRQELRILTEDDADCPYEGQPLDAWDSVETYAEVTIRTAKEQL